MAIRKVKPFRMIDHKRYTFSRVFDRLSDALNHADKVRARGMNARVITEVTKQGRKHFVWVR